MLFLTKIFSNNISTLENTSFHYAYYASLYVCMWCMRACACVACACACACARACSRGARARARVCVCVCVYIFVCVFTCLFVCLHVCLHVCYMCVYMCEYFCVRVHFFSTDTHKYLTGNKFHVCFVTCLLEPVICIFQQKRIIMCTCVYIYIRIIYFIFNF